MSKPEYVDMRSSVSAVDEILADLIGRGLGDRYQTLDVDAQNALRNRWIGIVALAVHAAHEPVAHSVSPRHLMEALIAVGIVHRRDLTFCHTGPDSLREVVQWAEMVASGIASLSLAPR